MKRRLELVTWRDANVSFDERDVRKDYLVTTAGWVRKDGRWLRIVAERTPSGDRSITRVPLVNVVKRRRLRVKH